MVLLTTTPTILDAISLLSNDTVELPSGETLPTEINAPISHRTLIQISKCLLSQSQPQDLSSLNALLRGTRPYHPPPPPKPEPTPEYKALMARLKAEEEQKAYRRMLQTQKEKELDLTQAHGPETHGSKHIDGRDGNESEEDDISPSLILNILLSIVMCAAVAFHLTRYWPNDGVRVLLALGTAILVGLAEVVVYNSFLRKRRDGRKREKRRKEVKIVLGEFTGEDNEAIEAWGEKRQVDSNTSVTSTEVVWGKGVHGGIRRRVREKWEREQEQQNEKQKQEKDEKAN